MAQIPVVISSKANALLTPGREAMTPMMIERIASTRLKRRKARNARKSRGTVMFGSPSMGATDTKTMKKSKTFQGLFQKSTKKLAYMLMISSTTKMMLNTSSKVSKTKGSSEEHAQPWVSMTETRKFVPISAAITAWLTSPV